MKNAIIFLSVLVGTIAAQAYDVPQKPALRSELKTAQLDAKQTRMNFAGGSVVVDLQTSRVELSYFLNPCKPNMLCRAMLIRRSVEVPLVRKYVGDCGSTYYVGRIDRRPVDGNLETVVIRDHSTDLCEWYISPDRVVEVKHTTITAGFNVEGKVEKFVSEFQGSAFEQLPELFNK